MPHDYMKKTLHSLQQLFLSFHYYTTPSTTIITRSPTQNMTHLCISKAISTCTSTPLFLSLLLFLFLLLPLSLHQLSPSHPIPNPLHLFLSLSSNSTLSSFLLHLTLHPHLAPSPPLSFHPIPTHTSPLPSLLSFPLNSSLSLNSSPLTLRENWDLPFVIPYHAYSPSASIRAHAVFANFGRPSDYRALSRLGVSVAGTIVVSRKGGGMSRADVAEAAAERGAAAVLTFGEGTVGFERGTAVGTRDGLGDPLSPGWPAGGEVAEGSEGSRRFPKIPSMPVSMEIAEEILGGLGGAAVPEEWRGLMKATISGVGPGPTVLDFQYEV